MTEHWYFVGASFGVVFLGLASFLIIVMIQSKGVKQQLKRRSNSSKQLLKHPTEKSS